MPINWDDIAAEAGRAADEHFSNQISSLTRLNSAEIESIILDSGISQQDLTSVLRAVKDATQSNLEKVQAIQSINKGFDALLGIVTKLI